MAEESTYRNVIAASKIPIGIEGFEQLTDGGPEGRSTNLVGTSGSGKTVFVKGEGGLDNRGDSSPGRNDDHGLHSSAYRR